MEACPKRSMELGTTLMELRWVSPHRGRRKGQILLRRDNHGGIDGVLGPRFSCGQRTKRDENRR